MNNLSNEQLKQIIETDHVQCGDAYSMAKELLAYREAAGKPVGYTSQANINNVTGRNLEFFSKEPDVYSDPIALYAAPQLPAVPDGLALVPIEPTEGMVIDGFESEPDETFSEEKVWEAYQAMSGCEQAAYRVRLCWAAMLAAAPKPNSET